jgi:hypothetical protein
MPPPLRIARAVAEQIAANASARAHADAFAGHRARLTQEILARAPAGGGGRLCLLGAGNAHDVDVEALAGAFREVHLVDVDGDAIEAARGRASEGVRARVLTHGSVDVSGVHDLLEGWAAVAPQVTALERELPAAIARATARLPGPFDVVVSCCLLTQMQLVLLQVLGDRHPRFAELRGFVNATHVRVLLALLAPAGVGLLMTDMTSNATYPLDDLDDGADLRRVMDDLIHAGNLIHAAHPGLLSSEVRRDPALKAVFEVRWPVGPWLWRNGPAQTFLVYGLELTRSRSPDTSP